MTGAEAAEKLWTDSQSDADLLADLRAAYRGRFDVRDALWWRAHPLEPTPDGVPDPAGRLQELQAAAYSRASAAEPLVEFVDPLTHETVRATESARRLRALMSELDADAAALDAAIESVQNHTGRRAFRLPAPGGASRRTLWRAALVATAVGAIVGAGVTTAVVQPRAEAEAEAEADVLGIFTDTSRRPASDDLPDLGDRFDPASIRSVTPAAAAESGYGMYVARNSDGHYCVVLQHPDRRIDARCADAEDIAAEGLRLDVTIVQAPFGPADEKRPNPIDASVVWAPDGDFAVSFSPRTPPHEGAGSCCGAERASRQRTRRG